MAHWPFDLQKYIYISPILRASLLFQVSLPNLIAPLSLFANLNPNQLFMASTMTHNHGPQLLHHTLHGQGDNDEVGTVWGCRWPWHLAVHMVAYIMATHVVKAAQRERERECIVFGSKEKNGQWHFPPSEIDKIPN